MKKKAFILFICLLAKYQAGYSQVNTFDSAFQFVTNVLELDYAGFFDKTHADKAGYERLKKEIQAESRNYPDAGLGHYLLLKKLLVYFDDPHLNLGFNTDAIKRSKLFNASNTEYDKKVNALSGLQLLPFSEKELDNLKGAWEDDNNAITIKQKSPFVVEGTITSGDSTYWFPGQSKFVIIKKKDDQYFSYFLARDHFLREVKTGIAPGEIVFGKFGRIFKGGNYFKSISGFQLVSLDKDILYLRIPDFFPQNTPVIDSIIRAGREKLLKASYLVIDIRNNPGGSSQSYQSFLPYLLTGPYQMYGSKIRRSERNIASYLRLANDTRFDSIYKRAFLNIADSLKNCKTDFYVFSTNAEITPDTIYQFPQKVIFLVNERSISAAEYILTQVKDSKKCLIAGRETYGALDYTDVSNVFIPAYSFIRINYAVFRNNRVDAPGFKKNSGIQPGILLHSSSREWIKDILSFIKSQKN